MDPYQPFSTTSKSSSAANDSAKPTPESTIKKPTEFAGELRPGGFVGFLDVFVHQARDIQNICIYHKQDVYARLCLTSDPDVAVSTQIINGGGRNPIFNESLRLGVRTVESSLKCEIWMLSKVKNYLEDQLLGFTLVPLADVLVANGKLAQEFSLSSTDLFHSPAGFIQLSLAYAGASPDVMALSAAPKLVIPKCASPDADNESKIPSEYQKLEFPDLKVANENHMMVSEYFGIDMETQCSETLIDPGTDVCANEEAGIRLVESFSAVNSEDSASIPKNETPVSSGSTSESTSHAFSATAAPSPKGASAGIAEGEADSPAVKPPTVSINMEPEATVVQQDIVAMYMKSMQQFTESLANMKLLPMDVDADSETSRSGNASASSDQQPQASKGAGSRVFYGSRAFF